MNSMVILASMVDKPPGVIMGPIDRFLGSILNIIFNGVFMLTEPNSLGITIIIFTIITRFLMLPSGIKNQKSMMVMKRIKPEQDKIKAKYGNSKDPETQRKMSAELQALYAKHNYNPFGGCLPLLITMPIFMALNYLLRQPFMFIERVGVIYETLAIKLMQATNYGEVIPPIAASYFPAGMTFDATLVSDVMKALNKFSSAEWDTIMGSLTGAVVPEIQVILSQKVNFETFIGLNLLNASGWTFPGIIIPLLSAASQFAYAFYSFKTNPPQDDNAKSTQMMMMIGMPLFMGYITAGMTMGVGLYWICGNLFMLAQQVIITRVLTSSDINEEVAT